MTTQNDADNLSRRILNEISSTDEQIFADTETCAKPEWAHERGVKGLAYEPGLCPFKSDVRLLQLGHRNEIFVIDLFKVGIGALELLRQVLERDDIWSWWVNGKFDYKMLAWNCDIIVSNLADLQVAGKLLNLPAINLAFMVGHFLGRDREKKEQNSDWSIPELSEKQLSYAAQDIDDMMDLKPIIVKELKTRKLWTAFSIETLAVPPTGEMELNGSKLDTEAHKATIDMMIERAREGRMDLLRDLSQYSAQMTMFEDHSVSGINLNSSKQLLDLLQKAGLDIEATNKTELKLKAVDNPLTAKVLNYKGAEKFISGFGMEALPPMIHPVTKRIHATFHHLFGPKTYRYSCADPNLQQIPRCTCKKKDAAGNVIHNCARNWFVPNEGQKYVIADYSAIEVLGGGVVANDDKVLAIFRKKLQLINARRRGEAVTERDERLAGPHYVTAAMVTGKDIMDVTKGDRQNAKPVNFGFLYGQMPKGFRIFAFVQYGVVFTLGECTEIREKFFSEDGYEGLGRWHVRSKNKYKDLPFVETIAGYQIPLDYNAQFDSYAGPAALNYDVQNPCAAGNKRALTLMHKMYRQYMRKDMRWKGPMLTRTVHDENHLEAPDHMSEDAARGLEQCMTEGMNRIFRRDDVVSVEASVGTSWADKA